jgi:hypothetical protein
MDAGMEKAAPQLLHVFKHAPSRKHARAMKLIDCPPLPGGLFGPPQIGQSNTSAPLLKLNALPIAVSPFHLTQALSAGVDSAWE